VPFPKAKISIEEKVGNLIMKTKKKLRQSRRDREEERDF